MIKTFKDRRSAAVFSGTVTRGLPADVTKRAKAKMDLINAATTIDFLRSPPGNHLEALKDDRTGRHSIRVNDQWRVCFVFRDGDAFEGDIMTTVRREDLDAGRVDFSDIAEPGAPIIEPIHPGELLRTEWLDPLGLSAYKLAKDIKVPFNRVTEIVHGRRGISAETALRLARYFGTDAQSWVNLQAAYDVTVVKRTMQDQIDREVSPRAA